MNKAQFNLEPVLFDEDPVTYADWPKPEPFTWAPGFDLERECRAAQHRLANALKNDCDRHKNSISISFDRLLMRYCRAPFVVELNQVMNFGGQP